MKSFIILTILFVSALAADNCWKNTAGRGVGKPLHACGKGLENDNSICRTPCKKGYKGIGPICWMGVKNMQRGPGKILECAANEEQQAGLCYKQCQKNSKGVGPICWGTCAKGMTDCGLMCTPDAAACAAVNKKNLENVFGLATSVANAFTGKLDIPSILKKSKNTAVGFAIASCPGVRFLPH
jgi:hypothetical protein